MNVAADALERADTVFAEALAEACEIKLFGEAQKP